MKHLKQAIVTVAMIIALALISDAQISVPHTFTTSVPISQLNTNFSTIADGALKRSGGNLTGNVTADSGVTIDGVDIGAVLGSSSASTGVFQQITTSNTGAASIDIAGGITAGTGNVGIVGTDGRIPALTNTYLGSLSAASLTGLPSDTGITTTWATPTYAGSGGNLTGNFTTNGAGGWTVDSGDVWSVRYTIIGKKMTVAVVLLATTVTAATGTQLRIAIPASKVANGTYSNPATGLNNGTQFNGFWQVASGDTYITVFNEGTAAVAWTASANATQLRFIADFEIQ